MGAEIKTTDPLRVVTNALHAEPDTVTRPVVVLPTGGGTTAEVILVPREEKQYDPFP